MKACSIQVALFMLITLSLRGFAAQPAPVLPAGGVAATNVSGPQIQFASAVYDFGKAVDGEMVRHEFVFTNAGDALLEITGVHPACGCTTAGTWSRQVEPGMTGTIPIQFNSARFAGAVAKTITVVCNDKRRASIQLQIRGTVWRPIQVNPQTVTLSAVADSPASVSNVVRIVSGLEQPITLSDPESSSRAFAAELKTIQPGKEFELTVRTVPPLKQGGERGMISIKTSATNASAINITTLAVVQPAVAVSPPQIVVPPGLATNATARTVFIRNNDVDPLTLYEPAVNAEGVEVQMKEVAPGRQFTLTLNFPAGFELTPGKVVGLSIKTSHPRFPVIKVPVLPMALPAPRVMKPQELPPRPAEQAVSAVSSVGRQ
jgi:hypothetical protein